MTTAQPPRAATRSPQGMPRVPLAWLAALLSLGAAGVHFAVAAEHFDEYWLYGWFFVVAAWLQALWAPAITSRRSRTLLFAGVGLNCVLVAIWLWTRLIAVPVGPLAGDAEAFGRPDALASALEAGAVLATVAMLAGRGKEPPARWPLLTLVTVTSVILAVGVGVVLSEGASTSTDHSGSSGHD